MESNIMYVMDENGQEQEMEIVFTFENDGNNYVVFREMNSTSDEVYASKYNEAGDLFPIETSEEWEMVEEVIGAFSADEENEVE